MSSKTGKKGHPAGKVWDWFEKGEQLASGYYQVTCTFCEFFWANNARPLKLKQHLAYDCKKVDSDTKIKVLTLLLSDRANSDEEIEETEETEEINKKHRKRKQISQTKIDDLEENDKRFLTSLDKEKQINKALVKLFVCCNLPFALIEHPFFHEFIKILRTTYNLPSRWILSNTLLAQETARIDVKVTRIIDKEINLTITFDG